ncbi:MAG: hypothetical protein methR_P1045 [Methyloprofundus sp.]|nr:MAG: hypothetical protein methR_P1045 [Methyloprofundus sp.]
MTKRNAISLLVAAGLTASCSTVADKTVESEPKRVLNAQEMEERATAIQAMQEMSAHLRSLQKFSVHADVSFDEVLDNGQKVLLNKAVEIKVERPSKLWAKVATEYSQREFYFDGNNFTIYTPDLGYFASFSAPATLGDVVKKAKNDYDIEVPIADLFLWGTKEDASGDVEEAIIVGIDRVNGVSCNHFAFREKEIDWQICIQRDGVPLPLKLVITEKGDVTQPQHISVLTWNTAPDLSDQNYTFTAKKGDQKIAFRKVKTDK